MFSCHLVMMKNKNRVYMIQLISWIYFQVHGVKTEIGLLCARGMSKFCIYTWVNGQFFFISSAQP